MPVYLPITPVVVPDNAFRTQFHIFTLALILDACEAKCSRLSKVTPRILGMRLPSTSMFSGLLTYFVLLVKRETGDLGADSRKLPFWKNSTMVARLAVILTLMSIFTPDANTVLSSAYDTIATFESPEVM